LHRWLGPRTGPRPWRPIPSSCYCPSHRQQRPPCIRASGAAVTEPTVFSPSLLAEAYVADQRGRRPRLVSGAPPSAMRLCAAGSGDPKPAGRAPRSRRSRGRQAGSPRRCYAGKRGIRPCHQSRRRPDGSGAVQGQSGRGGGRRQYHTGPRRRPKDRAESGQLGYRSMAEAISHD